MDFYIGTPHFTLIPQELFNTETYSDILKEMFGIKDSEHINSIYVEKYNAHMVYAIDNFIISKIEENKKIYPLALYFINKIDNINAYNKVILNIDRKNNITHIVIAQGKDLKLINTYKTGNFKNALYYLFLALKSLQINTALTSVCLYNQIDSKKVDILNNYFNVIEIANIDCNLITELSTQQ